MLLRDDIECFQETISSTFNRRKRQDNVLTTTTKQPFDKGNAEGQPGIQSDGKEEPLSGVKGEGTKSKPFDQGNKDA